MSTTSIFAFDIAISFDIKSLMGAAGQWGELASKDPLIVTLPQNRHIAIFEYGSVVFFNFTLADARAWLPNLHPFASRISHQEFSDNFVVHVGPVEGEPNTEELTVPTFSLDIVKLVAIVLSRSVSLEYFENKINRSLAELEDTIEPLARQGRLPGNRAGLAQRVGMAFNIEHELAYNLQLLDDPDVVWEGGHRIEKIYHHLSQTFDIQNRVQILQRKLATIQRSGEFIINRLQERTLVRQEYAIIALFVLDVILIAWEIFR